MVQIVCFTEVVIPPAAAPASFAVSECRVSRCSFRCLSAAFFIAHASLLGGACQGILGALLM